MSAEAAIFNRSSEGSIFFMQQEHAKTLKGLHEEIYSLQKRCTDLTFQLTMQGLTIDESDTTNEKLNAVQQDLDISKNRIIVLEKELIDRDRRIDRLESEARSQRKRWLDESRGQLQLMNSLRAELESKANNIAYLTTELHRLKMKNKNSQTETEEISNHYVRVHDLSNVPTKVVGDLPSDPTHLMKKPQLQYQYLPAPPRDKLISSASSASRIRRPGHTKSAFSGGQPGKPVIAVHPENSLTCRALNPRCVSGSHTSGSESPDITPFLPQQAEKIVHVMATKQPQILPPIPNNSSGSINNGNNSHQVIVHQVTSSTSQHRQNKSGSKKSEAAIVTLVVENAAPADAWPFAQESRNSENY